MTHPNVDGTSLGTVATAGVAGTLLILLAKASGNVVAAEVVTLIAPGLSSLAIWLMPHARLYVLLAFHRQRIREFKQVLERSGLSKERKERFQNLLDEAEVRLLEWQTAYFPRQGFHPDQPIAPQLSEERTPST